MVYIENWDEYQRAAEELYAASPFNTRYLSSYRHADGKLVLKVTDDRTCLKYATSQLTDLKKFDRLNRSLMSKMQQKKETTTDDPMNIDVEQPTSLKGSTAPVATGTPSIPHSTQSSKSTKKGKKSKR